MSTSIDARGLSCPQPVILTMNYLKDKPNTCTVVVDNTAAKENVSRYARQAGYQVEIKEENDEFLLLLTQRGG